jgi:hypothetical protein
MAPGNPLWEDSPVRRTAGLAFLSLLVAACGAPSGRDLVRYHDPGAVFTALVPAGAAITVLEPRRATASSPGVLAGYLAEPPAQATPSPAGGLGGGLALSQTAEDRTTFQALVVTTEGFSSIDDMTLYFLTGDTTFDVRLSRPIRVAGEAGRLIVADYVEGGSPVAGVAGAFSLGSDGVGYLLAAIFPAGTWEAERDDFLAMVRAFSVRVPPQEAALPVAVPTAA